MARERTDAEKLAMIERMMTDLQGISTQEPPAAMPAADLIHYEAVNFAYGFVSRNVLNVIHHGTTRTPKEQT